MLDTPMESACFMWNPVSAFPPPYFPGSAYLSSRAGLFLLTLLLTEKSGVSLLSILGTQFFISQSLPLFTNCNGGQAHSCFVSSHGFAPYPGVCRHLRDGWWGNRRLDWSPSVALLLQTQRWTENHCPSWGGSGGAHAWLHLLVPF